MSNVSLFLQYARIGQYEESAKNRRESFLRGGTLVPDYSRLLYILQTQIGKRFTLVPNDPTLTATSEYMYSLSGGRIINTTPIATPFIIIVQPSSLTVNSGGNANFLVAVSGGTQPYSYQWRFNGIPIGGQTNPTLALTNVNSGDAGSYSCIITDATGQVLTSQNATLTVNTPAIIGSYFYGDTDFFAALSGGTDTVPYQGTFSITHNASIVPPYPLAAGNNKQLVIRVPIGESLKSNWFNTAFNFGTIQPSDGIFRVPLNPVGLPLYTYYLTELASSFDFNSPNVLTLS